MITTKELKAFIRSNGIAWPGGYPVVAITRDCSVLSAMACRQEFRQCVLSIRDNDLGSQWYIDALMVYYEGSPLECEHTGFIVESAYGETE